MKGNNELRWNEATMIEAVQEYLDKRYSPNVVVDSVKGLGTDAAFLVKVKEAEKS